MVIKTSEAWGEFTLGLFGIASVIKLLVSWIDVRIWLYKI